MVSALPQLPEQERQQQQQQQGPVRPMSHASPVAAAASAQLRLHHLSGSLFYTLYTNLAMPPGDPLIKRIMPYFLKQQDIFEVEAKANNNAVSMSYDALTRMGQRRGTTLAQLVLVLRQMPEAAQLLNKLGFAADAAAAAAVAVVPMLPPTPQQQQQQQPPQNGLFQSLQPPNRTLCVDEGNVALFAVTLREPFASMATVTWHRELNNAVLCHGTEFRIKDVAATDQGQYRCAVQLANQLPGSPRQFVLFSLKVRAHPPQSALVPKSNEHPAAVAPQVPLPIDMERTNKYALLVSCQRYQHMQSLGYGASKDLESLTENFNKLGYRTVTLMDPSRAELLSVINRLCNILALVPDTAPHLFLLLDGHGTVVKNDTGNRATTISCFLTVDAEIDKRETFLRVEEDIVKPLADCLPGHHNISAWRGHAAAAASANKETGLLVVVTDMCRSSDCAVQLGGDFSLTVQGSQIHRLHSTSYGRGAATLVDSARHSRQSFGVSALNNRLRECLCDEQRLRVDSFLAGVSDLIRKSAERHQEQLPELQVSATKTSLSDLVLLSDSYSMFAANRLVKVAQPSWRKYALLIGNSFYANKECDLPFVRTELRKVAGALQLLGFQTIVCCDWARGDPGKAKESLMAVVKDFGNLLRKAGASYNSDGHPVQAILLVDGHGELKVSHDDPQNKVGRNMFLLPGGDSVDIDAELAKPLFDSLPAHQRLLLGFYDACRTADGLLPGVAPNIQSVESPDYYRFYTTGTNQLAHAGSRSGSFGVRALLHCLRNSCGSERSEPDRREALRPCQMLCRIADQVFQETHQVVPGRTQRPVFVQAPSRMSLADLEPYFIENAKQRLDLLETAWQLRERHGLI